MPGEKVLIVEDEGIVARETEYRLKDLGYNVCGLAASGAEALKKAERDLPDVVLMDIMLKGEMDGIETAGQIKTKHNIPVVYVTAHADETTLQRAKRTEPMGYLLKPFNERELHAAIEIALYKHKMDNTLKDREQLLGTTLKSIGDAVIVTDTAGAVTFMNPAAELLTRWKMKEATGKPVTQVFPVESETTRALVHPVSRALSESVVTTVRNHVLTAKGGREIPIDGTATPITEEDGRVHGAVLVFRDATGPRKHEEGLRLSQYAVDLMSQALIRLGGDGRILYANEAASRMLGYTGDDLVWLSMQDLDPAVKGSRWDLHMDRLREKISLIYETKIRSKKDDLISVEIRAHYFLFNHNEHVVMLIRDIAEEQALRNGQLQEGFYAQSLIDSASIMMIGLDREGAIRVFNKEVEVVTGYSEQSLKGKNLFEVILPISKNVSIWRSFLDWQASRLQLPISFEAPLATKSGVKRLISWRINETRDEEGFTGLVLVGVDVTDQKEMEQQISTRNEEILSLRRISEMALKRAPLEEIFQEIALEVASTAEYPFVAVEQYVEEQQKMILRGVRSVIPVPLNMEIPLAETLSGVAIRTGHVLVEKAASKRPEYGNGFLRKLGISTYVCVPIVVRQKIFGALTLGHTEAADVSEQLQHYALSVANQLALLLQIQAPEEDKTAGLARTKALLEASSGPLMVSVRGEITMVNEAALRLFCAQEAGQLVGKKVLDLVQPEDRSLLESYVQAEKREIEILPFVEAHMVTLDGKPLQVEMASGPATSMTGAVQLAMHDVTGLRNAERSALESEAGWRMLFSSLPDNIAVLQEDRYLFLNQGSAELFGYDRPEELVGKPFAVTVRGDEARLAERSSRGEQSPPSFEFTGTRKDGSAFYGEARVSKITYEGKDSFFVSFRDVSAHKQAEEERNAREMNLKAAFEGTGVPLVIVSEDMTIRSLNPAAEALFGVRSGDLGGRKTLLSLVVPEDVERVRQEVLQRFADKQLAGTRFRCHVLGGGGVAQSMELAVGYHGQAGSRVLTLLHAPELSTEKETAGELQDGARLIFDHLGTPAFVARQDSTIALVNVEFEKLCACSREEVEGKKSWREFVFTEDLAPVEEYIRKILAQPKEACRRYDLRIVSKDGSCKEMRLTATPVPGTDTMVFSLADMRERKWAEQAWQESEKKYRSLLEGVQEGVWILDPEGSTTFVNESMARLLHYQPEEMTGKRFFLFMHVKNAESVGQRWERCKQGMKEEFDAEFVAKDGTPVLVRLSSIPMLDDIGAFTGALFAVSDITERKAIEEKAQASIREKDSFLREIHHRVQNNLQVVSSLLYLQSKSVGDPQMLNILLESQERIRSIALIHEQLYKSEDLSHVNFRDYLGTLTTNLFQTYGSETAKVKLTFDADTRVSFTVDKAIPCGLIVNELVSNALKHAFVGRTGGTIFVSLRRNKDDTMSLVVKDDGIGLPPHVDFRHTPSLGLQLVNTLVNQLGATIQFQRKGGTVFTIVFP